jgi:hypothetical protein
MNRRSFFSVLTLGAVGTATSGAALAIGEDKVRSNVETEGPIDPRMLHFRAGTKLSPVTPVNNTGIYVSHDQYSEYKDVNLGVGQDGNLWVKSYKSEWKRVVTE